LAFIGDQLAEQKFLNHIATVCPQTKRNDRITDAEIVCSMIGLIAVSKPHFDAIPEYGPNPSSNKLFALNGCLQPSAYANSSCRFQL